MMQVNKQAVAAAFSRAAQSYRRHARLQRHSAGALLALTGGGRARHILDAGCGPGEMSGYWRQRGGKVTALDLSARMLDEARRCHVADRYLLADIEAIPLPDAQFDLVWSNLAIQWCGNITRALQELKRMTRPGGMMAFSTLTQGSLPELRQAWQGVDGDDRGNRFLPAETILRAMGSGRQRSRQLTLTLWFDDALSAMRSLKGTGATHLHQGRGEKPLTRGRLQRLQLAWPQRQGRFPLTYHLFLGVTQCD